jgi:outer membrane protein, multidrug efflux system
MTKYSLSTSTNSPNQWTAPRSAGKSCFFRWHAAAIVTAWVLAGCSSLKPASLDAGLTATAQQWQAPLPQAGQIADLARWWEQFNDPVLTRLITSAQSVSPTVAAASARIQQARAVRVAGGATLGPTLDASASATRGRLDVQAPAVVNSASIGLEAAWELDLFGAARAGRNAAQARLEGAQARWHDARISVAAETALSYVGLRACEAQLAQTEQDSVSRVETSRLTSLLAKAGFEAPANADLAAASAAQSKSTLTQQRAQCDLAVKALVALTALPEPSLREQFKNGLGRIPKPAQLVVAQIPAQALAQRPDLLNAERELAATSADFNQAQAQRWPRIALTGNIMPSLLESGDIRTTGTVWRLGPLSVTLPILDGGVRRANSSAAQARVDAATSQYAASLRTAVREVEEALITLQSTANRTEYVQAAADGFVRSYRAVESRHKSGLASLFELEDMRRNAVLAQSALLDLQRERVVTWINLYRALGGGWDSAPQATAAASTQVATESPKSKASQPSENHSSGANSASTRLSD